MSIVRSYQTSALSLLVSIAAVALVTAGRGWFHLTSPTIAALSYLMVVLSAAAVSRLWVAVVVSILADLCLNYFFMPPLGTFAIADAQNWVALAVFLGVSVIASRLSSTARDRAREALAQRDELARLSAERARLLEERKQAELVRQSEELKSALLASLSHDLRTPLTTIRVAASNLRGSWLDESNRREQADLVLAEVERLSRLFQNILEMAQIDAGALAKEIRWVHPSEIFEAARDRVEQTLRQHPVDAVVETDWLVRVDPRLTASALAHLLENAAQYSDAGAPIKVTMSVSMEGLTIAVRDQGPGIPPADLPHVFERFYRGSGAKRRVPGTGMGLSIARGMLAAQGGTVVAENCAGGGAQLSIVVPAEARTAIALEPTS